MKLIHLANTIMMSVLKGTICICCFCHLGLFTVSGQQLSKEMQVKTDSLHMVVQNKQLPDTTKAAALLKLADIYRKSNPDTLLHICQQAINIIDRMPWEKRKDGYAQKIRSDAMHKMVNRNKDDSTYASGVDTFAGGLKMYEGIGDRSGLADSLIKLGGKHLREGNFTKALEHWKLGLKVARETSDLKAESNALAGMGLVYIYQGYYTRALDHLNQSLQIKERIKDQSGIPVVINNIGLCHFNRGDFNQALRYHMQSLELREKQGNRESIAASQSNIGMVYNAQGNYNKALGYYQQCLYIRESLNDKSGISKILSHIGVLYGNQGDYEKSLVFHERSLKLSEELNDQDGINRGLMNVGTAFYNLGNYSSALDNFNRSFKMRDIRDKEGLAQSLLKIGEVYVKLGDYSKALDYFFRSLGMKEETGDQKGLALINCTIGDLYLTTKEPEKALSYLITGYKTAKKNDYSDATRMASRGLYRAYASLSKPDSAIAYANTLNRNVNRSLHTNYFSLPENEKELYFKTMAADYGRYIEVVSNRQQNRPELSDSVFQNILVTKGLSLKSTSALREAVLNSSDSSMIRIFNNWMDKRIALSKSDSSAAARKRMEEESAGLEKELISRSATFAEINRIKNISTRQIRNEIKTGEAVIEFVSYDRRDIFTDTVQEIIYTALVLTSKEGNARLITLCTEKDLKNLTITESLNPLLQARSMYGDKNGTEHRLYQLIWKKLEPEIQGIHTIYFAPGGWLYKINFAALRDESGNYLGKKYILHQLNSASQLLGVKNKSEGPYNSFFVMGGIQYSVQKPEKKIWNFLEGTKRESEKIYSNMISVGKTARWFTGDKATEQVFKSEAGKCDVIHLATHGFFFPDPETVNSELKTTSKQEETTPVEFRGSSVNADKSFVLHKNPLMRSGLILAGANDNWGTSFSGEGEDGVLTALEIANTNLSKARLVVLSACETGLGDIKGSEGVYGLQRGLKMAGAQNLMMSLWKVPDAESEIFMTEFYRLLGLGKDISSAFRLTQEFMRTRYEPYYWAAFILVE